MRNKPYFHPNINYSKLIHLFLAANQIFCAGIAGGKTFFQVESWGAPNLGTLGILYFVQATTGPIKIGFTTDFDSRLTNLQGGNPDPLTVLGIMEGTLGDEKALQKQFLASQKKNEWFYPTTEIIEFIAQNCV